jgi:hypothetical protein
MTDEEAAALPVALDAETILRLQISTWRTDAGDFDVLIDMPGADGRRWRYEDLVGRAEELRRDSVLVRTSSPDVVRPRGRSTLNRRPPSTTGPVVVPCQLAVRPGSRACLGPSGGPAHRPRPGT